MRISRISLILAVGVLLLFIVNQMRLAGRIKTILAERDQSVQERKEQAARIEKLEATLNDYKANLETAQSTQAASDSKLNRVTAKVTDLENRIQGLVQAVASGNPPRSENSRSFPIDPNARGGPGRRDWGPEQITGPPDTDGVGDIPTAWASREPDAGPEWLKLDYPNPVNLAEVRIRETYNPGAISKVTAFQQGQEIVLWEGVEPGSQAPVDFVVQVPGNVLAQSVKVYLDTTRVPGWNEIDAVELVGKDGSRQWAAQASASSTYAEPRRVRADGTAALPPGN